MISNTMSANGVLELMLVHGKFEMMPHRICTDEKRASAIGNTWRISNDIYNEWRAIWRITNEVVPYWRYTTAGAFPDMDMLMFVYFSFCSIDK